MSAKAKPCRISTTCCTSLKWWRRCGLLPRQRDLGIPKSRLSRRVSRAGGATGRAPVATHHAQAVPPVGETFLRHCQAVRVGPGCAGRTVAQVQTEPRGTIRVSCPVTLAHRRCWPS